MSSGGWAAHDGISTLQRKDTRKKWCFYTRFEKELQVIERNDRTKGLSILNCGKVSKIVQIPLCISFVFRCTDIPFSRDKESTSHMKILWLASGEGQKVLPLHAISKNFFRLKHWICHGVIFWHSISWTLSYPCYHFSLVQKPFLI